MNNYTQILQGFVKAAQQKTTSQTQQKQFNFYQKFIKDDSPLGILTSDKHSLQADMLFGWKPKLVSCPCPLKFPNQTVDVLIPLVRNDDRYKIAYIGNRPLNSIQINQQYAYNWRYRQRYSLNMAFVDQSYKQNAEQSNHLLINSVKNCEYSFDSSFQSGNLDLAIRIKPSEYDCYIRSDSNTRGHCNWFYFKVNNNKNIGQVQINICNLGKIINLYSKGMKPFTRQVSQDQPNMNWSQQSCYDVSFVQRLSRFQNDKKSFQLQFKYNFKSQNTQVLFAYGIPYTYSKLQNFIKQISENKQSIIQVQKLCQSLGGVNVPLIKITNKLSGQQSKSFQPNKKAVILTARIHPGQSHSSFLAQGFIKELLEEKSNILRQMFVFYIVPMLNPDGVIIGNYRTSYSGKDLNRQFQNLQKHIFPQIFYLHQLVMDIRKKHFKGVQFFFDFHGHSSKKNLFAYGPDHSPHNPYFLKSRIFAKLLEQITPVFSYKKSIFTISEGKKKTGRAHMIRKLKIPMVYTFQISNGMYQTKNRQNILLDEKILSQCGNNILKGLFKYAKVQMKIPHYLIKPKVDTGNINKRIIKSSKQIRTAMIKKRKSSINIQNLIKVRQGIHSAKLFSKDQAQNQPKIKDQLIYWNQNEQDSNNVLWQKVQLLKIVENLQNSRHNNDQSQGGSDSQSEGQDMSKQQTNKLFNEIIQKKTQKNIKNKEQIKKKAVFNKRPKMMTQNSKNILNQIKIQMKKDKNKQLLQILKQRNKKKQNNGQNYQTEKRIIKIPQRGLFRQKPNFANFMTNKQTNTNIQKVPIAQTNFNLQFDYYKA